MEEKDSTNGLYVMFCEAFQTSTTSGTSSVRVQWLFAPPALERYGIRSTRRHGMGRFLKRRIENTLGGPGKTKWVLPVERDYEATADLLCKQLVQYESLDWTIAKPIVVKLDHDDYLKMWGAEPNATSTSGFTTPYKALRAVERVTLAARGVRLIGEPNPEPPF